MTYKTPPRIVVQVRLTKREKQDLRDIAKTMRTDTSKLMRALAQLAHDDEQTRDKLRVLLSED
jgi:hypothetical protein